MNQVDKMNKTMQSPGKQMPWIRRKRLTLTEVDYSQNHQMLQKRDETMSRMVSTGRQNYLKGSPSPPVIKRYVNRGIVPRRYDQDGHLITPSMDQFIQFDNMLKNQMQASGHFGPHIDYINKKGLTGRVSPEKRVDSAKDLSTISKSHTRGKSAEKLRINQQSS